MRTLRQEFQRNVLEAEANAVEKQFREEQQQVQEAGESDLRSEAVRGRIGRGNGLVGRPDLAPMRVDYDWGPMWEALAPAATQPSASDPIVHPIVFDKEGRVFRANSPSSLFAIPPTGSPPNTRYSPSGEPSDIAQLRAPLLKESRMDAYVRGSRNNFYVLFSPRISITRRGDRI